MPYIRSGRRELYRPGIDIIVKNLCGSKTRTEDATYVIYKIVKSVFGDCDHWVDKAEPMKILRCVEEEYYRNVIIDHEELAKVRNGDI